MDLRQADQGFANELARSKKIELSYSLVDAGRATAPPKGDFSDLLKLFPQTFSTEVLPPYLMIRVRTMPPKPWPLKVAGLPVLFSTEEIAVSFDRGRLGGGPKALAGLDLHKTLDISE